MFEKEIKFIGDFCFNQVKSLGSGFTFEKITSTSLHPAIIQYVSAELEYMIYSDRKKLLQQSYFDYTGKEISDHFRKISGEIKRNKKISLDDARKLIFQAVSFNINYLVRPRWSLAKLIFNDQAAVSSDEMMMMLNYLYYYEYFKNVLSGYISKRNIVRMSTSEFDLILSKIDNELLNANQEQLISNSFTSIGDFFNIGGVDKNLIPLTAVEIFLKEKNLLDFLLKLKKTIPNGTKKQLDKNEITRILFTAQVETKPEASTGTEPEIEAGDTEKVIAAIDDGVESSETVDSIADELDKAAAGSFLSPEEEEALLSLYNEESATKGEVKEVSEAELPEEPKSIETSELEKVEPEKIEPEPEVQPAEEDISGITDVHEEIKGIVGAIEDFSQEVTEIEEPSAVQTSQSIESEIESQIDDTVSDLFKTGFEKEIVQEMIKDYYGEGDTDTSLEDETPQKPEEVHKTVPEDVIPKVESPEAEILNIFRNLDKTEEQPGKQEKPLTEQKETTPATTQVKPDVPLTGTAQTDSFDEYLKSINEAVFSGKKETIREEKKKIEVSNVIKDIPKKNEIAGKNLNQKNAVEKPPAKPRSIRPKDLFSYLRRKEVKKIVFFIFANDEEDFTNTADRIMDCHSYKEASEILKAVFTSYKISPYSKEAITFTNAVSNYFRQA
jgi:hypothetical protein